jgi:hypothetical protein
METGIKTYWANIKYSLFDIKLLYRRNTFRLIIFSDIGILAIIYLTKQGLPFRAIPEITTIGSLYFSFLICSNLFEECGPHLLPYSMFEEQFPSIMAGKNFCFALVLTLTSFFTCITCYIIFTIPFTDIASPLLLIISSVPVLLICANIITLYFIQADRFNTLINILIFSAVYSVAFIPYFTVMFFSPSYSYLLLVFSFSVLYIWFRVLLPAISAYFINHKSDCNVCL